MEDFNSYIGRLDYSNFIQFAKAKGKVHVYHKKDFLLSKTRYLTELDGLKQEHFVICILVKMGKEHVVGYAFVGEFICDYSAFIYQNASLVSIQAISECIVYQLSYQDIIAYWETNMETLRFGKQTADALYETIFKRLLDVFCDSPEESYLKLMKRCPNLKEIVPLKEIASYLRVTPTTVSNIRRKITFED